MSLQHTGVFALTWEQEYESNSWEGAGAGGENSWSWVGAAPGEDAASLEDARAGDVGKGSFFICLQEDKAHVVYRNITRFFMNNFKG